MQRFFDKVNKTDSCWNWIGCGRGQGYGAFKFQGVVIDAHRMSWIIHNGEIPAGLLVCHTCDNKLCVNPGHLFLGTHSDNSIDAFTKGRIILPVGNKFKMNHLPKNSSITQSKADFIKNQIANRTGTLKELAESIGVAYQLIRDINCNRIYKIHGDDLVSTDKQCHTRG